MTEHLQSQCLNRDPLTVTIDSFTTFFLSRNFARFALILSRRGRRSLLLYLVLNKFASNFLAVFFLLGLRFFFPRDPFRLSLVFYLQVPI